MGLPFMEYVHPDTGRKQRVAWDRTRSNIKLQEFKREAVEFFDSRDVERAKAAGVDIAADAKVLPTFRFNSDGSFELDPIAVKIKTSGEEVRARWLPKWQTFCAKPQNETDAEYAPVISKPFEPTIPQEPVGMNVDEARTYAAEQAGKVDMRTKAGRATRRGMANV
jgi:hypothetical protein